MGSNVVPKFLPHFWFLSLHSVHQKNAFLLSYIILNANWKTKNWGAWEWGYIYKQCSFIVYWNTWYINKLLTIQSQLQKKIAPPSANVYNFVNVGSLHESGWDDCITATGDRSGLLSAAQLLELHGPLSSLKSQGLITACYNGCPFIQSFEQCFLCLFTLLSPNSIDGCDFKR